MGLPPTVCGVEGWSDPTRRPAEGGLRGTGSGPRISHTGVVWSGDDSPKTGPPLFSDPRGPVRPGAATRGTGFGQVLPPSLRDTEDLGPHHLCLWNGSPRIRPRPPCRDGTSLGLPRLVESRSRRGRGWGAGSGVRSSPTVERDLTSIRCGHGPLHPPPPRFCFPRHRSGGLPSNDHQGREPVTVERGLGSSAMKDPLGVQLYSRPPLPPTSRSRNPVGISQEVCLFVPRPSLYRRAPCRSWSHGGSGVRGYPLRDREWGTGQGVYSVVVRTTA